MVKGTSAAPSKAVKTRGIPRVAIKRVSRAGRPSAPADAVAAPENPAFEMFPPAHGDGRAPGAGPTHRQASRRALKNWRVRSRLFLLVVIPTITAVAAGGIFIVTSTESAFVYGRVQTLANLSGKITGLVQALQNEREDTVRFIVLGSDNGGRGTVSSAQISSGPETELLTADYAVTNGWATQVEALASSVGGSYSALAQQDTEAAVTAIGDLAAIRRGATGTQLPAVNVIDEYANAIDTLLAVESQISVGSSDSTLAGSVRVLGLVSSMKEEASQQQALLTSALQSDLVSLGQFGPEQQAAVTDAEAQQQGDLNEFDTAATTAQRQLFNNVLSSTNVVQAQAQEQQAISLASSKSPIATDPTISDASSALSYVVSGMRSAEEQFADSVISRSASLYDGAITSAIIFSLAVALLLGIALAATIVIGRSMVGPLHRLRNGALKVAETRLPEIVRRMSETDGEGVSLDVEPIDVDSSDEIGEVARAFDQVHKEAVRLAANEAALRGNVNAMFVNLSRRSQVLVERQIRLITRLEQGEQDSKRLASLFQMDHLATRLRRNSENLLVLAGHELSRRGNRPVALVDVLRAAVSEIEQYERVILNVQVEVSIRREVVSDVVHLTAELAENAASFSAADTPVTIGALLPSSGGTLIEITDQGVGMGAEELAHANWRLDNPPVMDVAVSRRMGLFVVARLAARHGIRVRMRPAPTGGLIALIWLPDGAITSENSGPDPVRSGSMAAGNQAVTSVAGNVRMSIGETDHLTPPQGDRTQNGEPWAAAGLPPRRNGSQSRNTGPQTRITGPQQRVGDRLRAPGRLGAGAGPRDAEADQGGADQGGASHRNVTLPTPEASPLSGTEVVVPPLPHSIASDERLPIFEAMESEWFRHGRQAIGRFDKSSKGWSSPADDGWRAAEVVHAPASDGTTTAGLPKRPPKANLVPGKAAASAASEKSSVSAPGRPATETRDRYASFQRGIQQGRAAVTGGNPHSGEGTAS
jgi:signal transduction histidine kinase